MSVQDIEDDLRAASEAAAGMGLGHIAALAEACKDAKPQTKREALADYLADRDRVRTTRVAFVARPDDAQAAAMRIDPTGITADLKRWRAAVVPEQPKAGGAVREDPWTHGGDVPDGAVVPRGYVVDSSGVWDMTGTCVSPVMLAIRGLAKDEESGSVDATLTWQEGGRWLAVDVERRDIADSRRIIGLAARGFPVHSGNAQDVVVYLAAFEHANRGVLVPERVTRRLGWHDDAVFVLGASTVPASTMRLSCGPGEEQRAEAVRMEGTWEEWCRLVREHVTPHPPVMLAIFAAASSAFLQPLGEAGFAVDWSGDTSRGKTTTLRVGASVWGRPDETGLLGSWASSSSVGPCSIAAFLHSIPVILDDTRRGKPAVVGAVMYDIPAGQERIRGNVDGTSRRIRRWRTVLLSTGEASITSFSDGAGAAARCICIPGAPLGEESTQNAREADAIREGFLRHYGHLGPRLVAYILEHWGDLRERHRALQAAYSDAVSSSVGHRVSAYVATLALAAEVCSEIGVPGDPKEAIGVAIRALSGSEVTADKPASALDEIVAWAILNQSKFYRRDGDAGPPQGLLGVWANGEVAFHPHELRQRLLESGYDAEAVLQSWHRTGVTLAGDGGRRTKQVRMPRGKPRMVVFPEKLFVGDIWGPDESTGGEG